MVKNVCIYGKGIFLVKKYRHKWSFYEWSKMVKTCISYKANMVSPLQMKFFAIFLVSIFMGQIYRKNRKCSHF
jgi:hypothetical protein